MVREGPGDWPALRPIPVNEWTPVGTLPEHSQWQREFDKRLTLGKNSA